MEFENTFYLMRGILSAVNVVPFTLSIVSYVLTSLGLYAFASRRMINHPWLSWVPIANMWILGSLSDQYRYVSKGQKKSKRKILLGLNIASATMVVLAVILLIAMVVGMVSDAAFGMIGEEEIFNTVFGGVVGLLGFLVLALPLTITTLVFRYMALYDVYLSCDPENAVLFLVLSIIFSVTEPFFLFFNRNKDKGMPPRRAQPEYIPSYEVPGGRQEQPFQAEPQQAPHEPEDSL